MASEKQIAANRQNAQKSTGPKDTTKTRYNRTWHGLRGSRVVLPNESMEEYLAMAQTLYECFQPEGTYEFSLVKYIADAMWKLERVTGMGSKIFEEAMYRDVMLKELRTLEWYQGSIERSLFRCRRELSRVQALRGKFKNADLEPKPSAPNHPLPVMETTTYMGAHRDHLPSQGEVALENLLDQATSELRRASTPDGVKPLQQILAEMADMRLSTEGPWADGTIEGG